MANAFGRALLRARKKNQNVQRTSTHLVFLIGGESPLTITRRCTLFTEKTKDCCGALSAPAPIRGAHRGRHRDATANQSATETAKYRQRQASYYKEGKKKMRGLLVRATQPRHRQNPTRNREQRRPPETASMDAALAATAGAPTDDLSGSLFDMLPNEVVAHMLDELSCADQRLRASLVCRRWHDILREPSSGRATACFVSAGDAREGLLRAACCGHVDCVARLCARGAPYDLTLYEETVQKDDVAVLQVLGIREDVLNAASVVSLCAQYASARCLAYALAQCQQIYTGSTLSLWWYCDKADALKHAACWETVRAAGHRI